MPANLQRARKLIEANPRLAGFEMRQQGDELHLERKGDTFARLIPTEVAERWRIETFRNTEEWEIVDFTGRIEECLEFLTEHPNYLYWER